MSLDEEYQEYMKGKITDCGVMGDWGRRIDWLEQQVLSEREKNKKLEDVGQKILRRLQSETESVTTLDPFELEEALNNNKKEK